MRVSVICIGNELLMDEGVGPACARYLQTRYALPPEVQVFDRACMGMAVISDLRACDFMLVLDAVEVPGARPGQVFSFEPDDTAMSPAGMTSLHEVRFADVLASAKLLGIERTGHCLGIQVENMSPSEFVMALTPRVAAALPLLAQAAVRYLRNELGFEVRDLLAEGDPLRAGRGLVGARDFSRTGVCGGSGPTVEASELAAAPQVAYPQVYGEPDCTVMARYLSGGLAAVGAEGAWDEAVPACVRFLLPAGEQADELAARFGLEMRPCDDEAPAGWAPYAAWMSSQATDYDCDALIGSCLELIEAVGRS